MGYCPRCGENHAWGDVQRQTSPQGLSRPLRIRVDSRIARLPADLADGAVIAWGGSRFRVHREDQQYRLEHVD